MKKNLAAAFAFLALAAVAATVEWPGIIQYATDNSIAARKYTATPGQIFATEIMDSGSNQVATLTVGTPDSTRVRVIDRYALHRMPTADLDPSGYYIELGEDTSLLDAKTVRVFDHFTVPGTGINPDVQFYKRTFRIVPLGDGKLTEAKVKIVHSEYDGWSGLSPDAFLTDVTCEVADDGAADVSITVKSQMNTITYTVDLGMTMVRARLTSENDPLDDLTCGDYHFVDTEGKTTLGTLRKWIKSRYDSVTASAWAKFAATEAVNLAGNILRLNRAAYFETATTTTPNDTVNLWQNGELVLRAVSGLTTNGSFRIVKFDYSSDPDNALIYTTTDVTEPPTAQVCQDLVTQAWQLAPNQSTELGTLNGEPVYIITVAKTSASRMFYRAVSNSDTTAGVLFTTVPVYAKRGIALQSPNGKWWRLTVDNSGNLTTAEVADEDVPEGVQ